MPCNKTDIVSRAEIITLVNTFYKKVETDNVIGYFFTDVMKVNWDKHLPTMYNFWENVLFGVNTYQGNPMQVHQKVHSFSKFSAEHFAHWVKIFCQTVDELFEGNYAEQIKQKATSIATVMQIKVLHPQVTIPVL